MNKLLIVLGILIAIVAVLYLRKPKTLVMDQSARGVLTIFGSMGCGWTKKQLDHCEKKKIPYMFVDCDSEKCPGYVKGFPTMKTAEGDIIEGFREL